MSLLNVGFFIISKKRNCVADDECKSVFAPSIQSAPFG